MAGGTGFLSPGIRSKALLYGRMVLSSSRKYRDRASVQVGRGRNPAFFSFSIERRLLSGLLAGDAYASLETGITSAAKPLLRMISFAKSHRETSFPSLVAW